MIYLYWLSGRRKLWGWEGVESGGGIKEKCEILFFHHEHLIANCKKLKSQEVAA